MSILVDKLVCEDNNTVTIRRNVVLLVLEMVRAHFTWDKHYTSPLSYEIQKPTREQAVARFSRMRLAWGHGSGRSSLRALQVSIHGGLAYRAPRLYATA